MALRYAGRESNFFARVDTGASFCVFQRLHAETVGIAVESGIRIRISTVTGGFLAYAHRVALSVLGIEVEATVCFAEDPPIPLGRLRIGLVHHDRWLYVSHYDDVTDDER